MLKKKVKKYLLISGISFAIGTLGIIFVSVLIEEVVRAIAGEEANKQITQSDLEGLPAWITVEMVQAAIDMMNETGYPASVVLGQMILEAGQMVRNLLIRHIITVLVKNHRVMEKTERSLCRQKKRGEQ